MCVFVFQWTLSFLYSASVQSLIQNQMMVSIILYVHIPFLHSCIFFYLSCSVLSEEVEEHDWIFSADQMVDEEAGMCACLNLCLGLLYYS